MLELLHALFVVRDGAVIYCPYCEKDCDMEFGPDDVMPEETDTARLIKIVRDEEVELIDGLLSLALTGGDYEWM